MVNTKRLTVAMVVLFAGLVLTGCQTYAYSKIEKEVFKEMDKLSRNIPEGLVEQEIERSGSSSNPLEVYNYADSESSVVGGGKLRRIRYSPPDTFGDSGRLTVGCFNFNNVDDNVIKQLREEDEAALLKLTDSVNFFGATREGGKFFESYVLMKESDAIYDVIYYEKGKGSDSWIRYEGVYDSIDSIEADKIKQSSERKKSPAEQVQRYIDLAKRFDETYSFPKGKPNSFCWLLAKGTVKEVGGSIKSYVESVLKEHPELVNAKLDGWKQTPLHLLAYDGQKDAAELLIAKGADVNAKDKRGYTPLHRAAAEGSTEIAELLLANGADVNAKNNKGETPLKWAIDGEHKEVIDLLKKHGAVK